MPFSLRELHWMLEASTDVSRAKVDSIVDCICSVSASQMAHAESMHTGKRVSPEKFYQSRAKRVEKQPEINLDGFAMMKAAFVK